MRVAVDDGVCIVTLDGDGSEPWGTRQQAQLTRGGESSGRMLGNARRWTAPRTSQEVLAVHFVSRRSIGFARNLCRA